MSSLFLFVNITLWILVAINGLLAIGGVIYSYKVRNKKALREYPMVSIIVPAHNEGLVIRRTVISLLELNYPQESYEIIVVNDNSSDNSKDILENIQTEYPDRTIKIINTDNSNGGKGKSNALNIALAYAKGSVLAIYDADNTPEPNSLKHLVNVLIQDEKLGAAVGKFRTRNKNASLLTKFVNLETLIMQYMNQAGRSHFFSLAMIPGTNYVVKKNIIDKLGGWDEKALTEDAELSFRIYKEGYYIKFVPEAVTWEQEPQKITQWFKQRARWARGNFYVIHKHFGCLFNIKSGAVKIDILHYLLVNIVMLISVTCSDFYTLLGLLGLYKIPAFTNSILNFVSLAIIYFLTTLLTLTNEKKEFTLKNVLLLILMMFTYSKLWIFVVIYSIFISFKRRLNGQKDRWDKTVRFNEN